MDISKIEQLAKSLLQEIGEDQNREGLKETPRRFARAYEKLFEGYEKNPKDLVTEFDGEDYDEMIICKDIDLFSTCEHHMLPFLGKAHIGYIPDKKIIGITKLPRLVEIYARRLQNQERLTMQIATTLNDLIKPKGVGIVIEAQHLCMMSRGVQKQNTVMTTSYSKGLFRTNSETRDEFLKLIK